MDPDELLGRIRGQLSDDDFDDLVSMLGQRRAQAGAKAKTTSTGGGSGAGSGAAAGTRPARGGGRRTFGHTWWGRAWVDAIETKAHLDPNRLPRGRTYARQNRVLSVEADTGEVKAFVQGSRPRPYHVVVAVRQFTDPQWDQLLDAVAAKAAHAAALLDGELLPEIADEADLLPGPGDLVPNCSCPDWADPCKHAAAVCYLIADLLDADPFTLFLLRGRDRAQVLGEIRSRRRSAAGRPGGAGRDRRGPAGSKANAGAAADDTAAPTATVSAKEAFARATTIDPADRRQRLAALGRRSLPPHPTAPAPLAVDPPAESGILADDVAELGADAAERAFEVLAFGSRSGLELTFDQDLARRAAQSFDESGDVEADAELRWIAATSGVPLHLLRRDARAWLLAGAEAIDMLYQRWSPAAEQMEEGRDALAMAAARGTSARVRADANRLVAGPYQLRLAPSGRWYRLDKSAGQWELRRRPEDDPADLFVR